MSLFIKVYDLLVITTDKKYSDEILLYIVIIKFFILFEH